MEIVKIFLIPFYRNMTCEKFTFPNSFYLFQCLLQTSSIRTKYKEKKYKFNLFPRYIYYFPLFFFFFNSTCVNNFSPFISTYLLEANIRYRHVFEGHTTNFFYFLFLKRHNSHPAFQIYIE